MGIAAGGPHNPCDEDIPGGFQGFLYAGSGGEAPLSQGDVPQMLRDAQGGVDGDQGLFRVVRPYGFQYRA